MSADAIDNDDDENLRYFGTGPGRRKMPSTGPVIELYADGSIDKPCPDCGVAENEFCRHPSGALRISPCGGRKPTKTTSPLRNPEAPHHA